MEALELGEAGISVVAWVDVEHQETTAGGDADVGRWPGPADGVARDRFGPSAEGAMSSPDSTTSSSATRIPCRVRRTWSRTT